MSSATTRGWPEGWSVPAVPPLPQAPAIEQPHRPDPYRGWPSSHTAGPGEQRYAAMCRAIDAATAVAALREIRDEAEKWLSASAGRNLQAAREAADVRERAQRKLAAMMRGRR